MIEILTTDVREAARKFGELRKRLLAESEKGMGRGLLFLKARIQEGLRSGSKAEGAERAVRRRSGMLSGSINTRTELRGLDVWGFIGSHAPQARLLEHGGKVVPKNAKWLTIPVPGGPALTASGVPRGRARDFDLRFVPSPRDRMTAFLMGGDRKNAELYFVLKKEVTIEQTSFFSGPVRANEPKVQAYIQGSVDDAVQKAGL